MSAPEYPSSCCFLFGWADFYLPAQHSAIIRAINKDQKDLEIVRFALYLSLFAVPLAGWLALSSLTESFTVLSFNLSLLNSLLGAEYIGGLHEFLGKPFYCNRRPAGACAALMHHFIFKDNVLKSMLIRSGAIDACSRRRIKAEPAARPNLGTGSRRG